MLPYHSALRAFILTAAHHKRPYAQELLHTGNEADPEGTIVKLLKSVDLEARAIKTADVGSLSKLGGSFPVLAKRATEDWIIVVDIVGNLSQGFRAFVVDIANEAAGIQQVSFAKLAENWGSVVILCSAKKRQRDVEKTFGFSWFFEEILKYKSHFRDIAIASFVLSLSSAALLYLGEFENPETGQHEE